MAVKMTFKRIRSPRRVDTGAHGQRVIQFTRIARSCRATDPANEQHPTRNQHGPDPDEPSDRDHASIAGVLVHGSPGQDVLPGPPRSASHPGARVVKHLHPRAVLAPFRGMPRQLRRAEYALGVRHHDRQSTVGGGERRDASR